MRYCIALRGPIGSGKSTWIKQNNLEEFTVSTDHIRTLFGSPELDINGKFNNSGSNEKEVWELFNNILNKRFKNGDFTVIDATNIKNKSLKKLEELCKEYKYKLYIKEFDTELNQCLINNLNREEYKQVDEKIVKDYHEEFKETIISNRYNKINELKDIYPNFKLLNKVKIIGDIHGCYDVLYNSIEPIDQNTTYIFLGDYFDRGIQNFKTFEYIESLMQLPNFIFLEGNHDVHLMNYVDFDKYSAPESFKETKEEFSINDLLRKRVKNFYKNLKDNYFIEVNSNKYILSHGGISRFLTIDKLIKIPSKQFIKGIGKYETEIDKIFTSNSLKNQFQVHGHRSLLNDTNSISLEDSVEFGGNLCILEIDSNGHKLNKYKNNIYNHELCHEIKEAPQLNTPIDELNQMSKYRRLIKIKKIEKDLCSINFTRLAFKQQNWNLFTTKARGLFVNPQTGDVIARSYSKFFNLEEHENLINKIDESYFPMKCWLKENGFLGILSVYNNELTYFSKSTNKSEYANYFKELFETLVPFITRENLKKELIKNNNSIVFEVIDIVNDNLHPISNKQSKIVLLNSFDNSLEEIKDINLNSYLNILKNSNVEYKQLIKIINSKEELIDFIKFNLKKEDFINPIEGYVMESDKLIFKIKTNEYNKLKKIRNKLLSKQYEFIDEEILKDYETNKIYNPEKIINILKEREIERINN